MCSPDSSDQTRSNAPSAKGCCSASATLNVALSASPCASASPLARAACLGLSVMPVALALGNLLATCLEEPPMPHPTSTISVTFSTPAKVKTASIRST